MPQVRKKAPMNPMLRSATAIATIAALAQPTFAASTLPLVTTQPDPQPDVRPISSPTPTLAGPIELVPAGHRRASPEGEIRFRDLQREPLVRPRVWNVSGRQRALFRRQVSARTRRHAGLHRDLSRHEYRRDRHRSAVSRRAGAELDDQGLDRPFPYRPRRQARRQERRPADGQVRVRRVVSIRAFRQRPRARRWASSSPASSWRISTATPSRSSGATPAASPSSTTSSPPRTRPRPRTPSP